MLNTYVSIKGIYCCNFLRLCPTNIANHWQKLRNIRATDQSFKSCFNEGWNLETYPKSKLPQLWALCSATISKAIITLPFSLCWHQYRFDRAYAVQRRLQCGIQEWLQPAGYQPCSSGQSTSEHWISLHLDPPQSRSAPQGYQHHLTVTHSQSEKKLECFYILRCIYSGFLYIWPFSLSLSSPSLHRV